MEVGEINKIDALITPRWTPADWRPLKERISTRSWIPKNEIKMTVLISTYSEVHKCSGN
jgi:hypothetical protein